MGTRIAPEQVIAELRNAGYRLAREHGFLPNQYFLVFVPELCGDFPGVRPCA